MAETSQAPAAPVRARRNRVEAPPAAPPPAAETPRQVEAEAGPVNPAQTRKPFGKRIQKLDNTPLAGFHCHWFNDYPGRIQAAKEAGYEHILDRDGKPQMRITGVAPPDQGGGGMRSYRMKIPIEWYEEDQKAKRDRDEEKMKQIRHGVVANTRPGEDGFYQPVNKAGTLGADIRMGNRKP